MGWNWSDIKWYSIQLANERQWGWLNLYQIKHFLSKSVTRECYCIIIKKSIQQEYITTINIYVPNIGASKYLKQTFTKLKGGIDNSTIMVEYFNTPLSAIDRSSIEKINKATMDFNNTINWKNLKDI